MSFVIAIITFASLFTYHLEIMPDTKRFDGVVECVEYAKALNESRLEPSKLKYKCIDEREYNAEKKRREEKK